MQFAHVRVTPKGGQAVSRVTSYLTKLRVAAILLTSASAENTTQLETLLVYNSINLAQLIKCLNDHFNPNRVRRTLLCRY